MTSFVIPAHSENLSKSVYKEGLRKYILRNYKGAIKDFKTAYKLNKKDSKIKGMYVNALIKQGNIEYNDGNLYSSERYFSRALSLSGKDAELRRKLNQIKEEIGKIKGKKGYRREMARKKKERRGGTGTPVGDDREDERTKTHELSKDRMPVNIERFMQKQSEENVKILSKIIESQSRERASFHRNLMVITESQGRDRRFFSQSILFIIGGGVIITFLIIILVFFIARRQSDRPQVIQPGINPQVEFSPDLLLGYTENIDETKYLTDENYSGIAKAKNLRDLYSSLKRGEFSWEIIQQYITELNYEVKSEILNVVEDKIKKGEPVGADNTLKVLMPFISDGDSKISARSRKIAGMLSGETGNEGSGFVSVDELQDTSETLSMGTLLQFAMMSDEKSGRKNHSINVADISSKIVGYINKPEIDPELVKKAGLIHDIGYLEIDDSILRAKKELTQIQLNEVKMHTEKGLKFIRHADPPDIFINGIKYHHERLDGSGYPNGLKKSEIPFIARIIMVADFFEAVTSPRPHRDALSIASALEMINKNSGKHFDSKIVQALIQIYQ